MTTPRRGTRLPENPHVSDAATQSTTLALRARRGALWTGASAILVRFSNVLVMIVVARIIAPDELGVYALAITVHGLVVCVAAWGVGSAVGRRDLDADRLAPTVTTFTIASSCCTAAAMILGAGPLAAALGTPQAAGPIRILAIAVALTGILAVPVAQIQRTFRQQVTFRANAFAFVASTITLLLLATVGNGAVAFAWSRVVGHLVVGITILLSLEKRYRPGWQSQFVVPLLRFGVPAAVGGVLSQLVLNIDFVIVGRSLSTTELGHYMLAFNICSWPTAVLGAVMNEIVLPAFSGVRHAGGDLTATVSRAVRTVALVACPIAAFTFAFASPLIETLYGGRWLAAAPVASVLALYGVIYVLTLLFDNILLASGHTVSMFVVQAVALVTLIPTLIAGVRLNGILGVAVGHILVAGVVTLPMYLIAIHSSTGAGLGVMLRAVSRPCLAAAAAAGCALLATGGFNLPIARLAVGGVVGLIVYIAAAGEPLLELLPARIADQPIILFLASSPRRLADFRPRRTPVSDGAPTNSGPTRTADDGGAGA